MAPLVLSLFPGIGLLDRAFEEEGFCVVRGPDLLWGGDVKRFSVSAGRFDGVIGGPPCQAFSDLRHMILAVGGELAPNLIPEYERIVGEACPTWFVMENVPDAPLPAVDGYVVRALLLKDHWVGGMTHRLRRFSFGTRDGIRLSVDVPALLSNGEVFPAVHSSARRDPRKPVPGVKRSSPNGPRLPIADMAQRQGVDIGEFKHHPFTRTGLQRALGNGVPLPMGRAIAKAVRQAMGYPPSAGAVDPSAANQESGPRASNSSLLESL